MQLYFSCHLEKEMVNGLIRKKNGKWIFKGRLNHNHGSDTFCQVYNKWTPTDPCCKVACLKVSSKYIYVQTKACQTQARRDTILIS